MLTETKELALGAGGLEFRSPRTDQSVQYITLAVPCVVALLALVFVRSSTDSTLRC
jgi:hypothetical protein